MLRTDSTRDAATVIGDCGRGRPSVPTGHPTGAVAGAAVSLAGTTGTLRMDVKRALDGEDADGMGGGGGGGGGATEDLGTATGARGISSARTPCLHRPEQ